MAPLPILMHGASDSHILHKPTERIINSRLPRIKTSIEILKLSAAHSGAYSLSANQVGLSMSLFVMHKYIPYGTWITDEAMKEHCT